MRDERHGGAAVDVTCVGETMVAFASAEDPRWFHAVAAGAESNVAAGLAGLGHRVRWVSRVGDDPLGQLVEDSIAATGVEVAVERDPGRPTGVMTRHLTDTFPITTYHRVGSAASALSTGDLKRLGAASWVHLTGITPALSASASDLVDAALARREGRRISFDVNLRPSLWSDCEVAAARLVDIARRSDLVFIGADEATALLGADDAAAVAASLLRRDDQMVVLKRGAVDATAITRDGRTTVPALVASVVDETGAGDAFAAGYLAGTLRHWPVDARLRLGHLMGSRVVAVVDHMAPPLEGSERALLSPEALERLWP